MIILTIPFKASKCIQPLHEFVKVISVSTFLEDFHDDFLSEESVCRQLSSWQGCTLNDEVAFITHNFILQTQFNLVEPFSIRFHLSSSLNNISVVFHRTAEKSSSFWETIQKAQSYNIPRSLTRRLQGGVYLKSPPTGVLSCPAVLATKTSSCFHQADQGTQTRLAEPPLQPAFMKDTNLTHNQDGL